MGSMGMSKSQKERRYGTAAATSKTSKTTAGRSAKPSAEPIRSPHVYEVGAGELAADPTRSSSTGVVVSVLCVVALALWAYYHWVILMGLSTHLANDMSAPELLPGGFSQHYLQDFALAISQDGPRDYSGVHWTTGLFTPLFVWGAFTAFTGINTERGTLRTMSWGLGLTYLMVFLGGNIALDMAVRAPDSSAALASGLVIGRWILTGGLVAVVIVVLVQVVRGKLDAFSRGELPGQQPLA